MDLFSRWSTITIPIRGKSVTPSATSPLYHAFIKFLNVRKIKRWFRLMLNFIYIFGEILCGFLLGGYHLYVIQSIIEPINTISAKNERPTLCTRSWESCNNDEYTLCCQMEQLNYMTCDYRYYTDLSRYVHLFHSAQWKISIRRLGHPNLQKVFSKVQDGIGNIPTYSTHLFLNTWSNPDFADSHFIAFFLDIIEKCVEVLNVDDIFDANRVDIPTSIFKCVFSSCGTPVHVNLFINYMLHAFLEMFW